MKKAMLVSLFSALFWSGVAQSSLTLSADRLIYNEKDGDASVTIHSDEDRAHLIQSWLDAGNSTEKKTLPFVVTPPLFRLGPKSDNVIRIMYLGSGLPTDRESLFWLDVKGVPGLTDQESKVANRMVIAINNRIKFFYRPSGLTGSSVESIKKAHWSHAGNVATVKNDSAYYVVLSKIVLDQENVPVSVVDNNTVVPPFGEKQFKLKHAPASGSTVTWEGITEFGGSSETYTQHLD